MKREICYEIKQQQMHVIQKNGGKFLPKKLPFRMLWIGLLSLISYSVISVISNHRYFMKRSLFYHFCYLIFSRLSFEMFELENELWKKRKIGPLKVDSNLKLARKQTGIRWGKTLYTRNYGANTFKRLNFRTGKIRGDSHAKNKISYHL